MSFDASTLGHRIWTDQHHRDPEPAHSRSHSQVRAPAHYPTIDPQPLTRSNRQNQHALPDAHDRAAFYPQALEPRSEAGQFEHQAYKGSKGRHSRPGSAFHPYKSSQTSPPPPSSPPAAPSAPPPKSIQFIDATFQPDGTTDVTQGGGGVAHCRPKRKKITQAQLTKLVETFNTTDNPGFEVRDSVGKEIGMSNREVQVWFQNRRAKVTRERASALAKANPTRPPLLSQERLPSPTRTPQPPVPPQPNPSATALSAAQHQWRYSNPELPQVAAPRPSHERPNGLTSTHHGSPEGVPHYRRMFGEQKIVLPRPTSPLPSPEVSSAASETSSSYFANSHTPPLSYTATTPGAESPRWSTRGFPTDHSRAGNSAAFVPFGSPASAFGQLTLRSPPIRSPISEREPFFFATEMPSPTMSEPGEMIRLAPMRTQWNPSSTPKQPASFAAFNRRRSLSNPELAQTAEARSPRPTRPTHVRLPSIRDLLNPIVVVESPTTTPSLTPSISTASTSASPVTPTSQSPFATFGTRSSTPRRPTLASRHTTDVLPPNHRLTHRRYPSTEAGLTGLGVLSEFHPASRAQYVHSLYSPY
ncbi:hypothetical protein JCM11491_004754 [Sporobolomyces phaffii]